MSKPCPSSRTWATARPRPASVEKPRGNIHSKQGRWAEAKNRYEQALAIFQDLGDRQAEALTFMHLGIVHASQGDQTDAHVYWRQALALLEALGAPEATQVKAWLEE